MAQSPWHTRYHVEPKWDFSMIQMAFLILMANGFSLPELPLWCSHGLKSWAQLESDDLVHFRETESKFCQILHWIATVPTLVLPCSLAITCSYFIQEMSVMKTGSVTLTKLVL